MQEITQATDRYPPLRARPDPVDAAPDARPGVPQEAEPRPDEGAHWARPPRQQQTVSIFRRRGLEQLTPVFGTAQPPHGLSGLVRWAAYQTPEHRARHWAALMLADRIDIMETRLGRTLARPLRENGFAGTADFVERNALPLAVGGAFLAWMLVRRPAHRVRKAGGRARRRGAELRREATERGRELGADLRERGLDLGREAGRRSRDLGGQLRRRGRELARHGLELGEDIGRRGQELVSELGERTGLLRRRRWYNRLGF